jgi:hypothetical protein
VAVVRVWGAATYGAPGDVSFEAKIVGHDGRRLSWGRHVVEVLPGPHVFELKWKRFEAAAWPTDRWEEPRSPWVKTGAGRLTVDLEAEAGHEYRLVWPAKGKPHFRADP